jgi:uncharacterized membrane protein
MDIVAGGRSVGSTIGWKVIPMMGWGYDLMGTGLGGWGGSLLGGLSMLFMGIIPLLVIGLIVWLVVESTRRRDDRPGDPYYAHGALPTASPPAPAVPDARAVLDARYARGEIEREEYLRRRSDLT